MAELTAAPGDLASGNLIDSPPRVLVAHGRPLDRELARAGLTRGDLSALLRERINERRERKDALG